MNFGFLKPARCKVEKFRRGRDRVQDDDFIVQCGLPDNPTARRAALAVRRAAASVGLVDSQYIRADDGYPGTLEVLPLWDSMDWLEFLLELEDELGQKVPKALKKPSFVHSSKPVTIREMAAAVYAAMSEPEM